MELTSLVAPPDESRRVGAAIEGDGRSLTVPPDYAGLLAAYGPGTFDHKLQVFAPGGPLDAFDLLARTREDAYERFLLDHEYGACDVTSSISRPSWKPSPPASRSYARITPTRVKPTFS
jgi:hypothetical protein